MDLAHSAAVRAIVGDNSITLIDLQRIMIAVRTRLIAIAVVLVAAPSYAQTAAGKIDKQVAMLIEKMVNKRTEQRAFTDLEALGCTAVPAIITRMDDRRNLPDPSISLENKSPGAFEGLRHYCPQKIVDALAAVLNQLTGQDFGSIITAAQTQSERKPLMDGTIFYAKRHR